MALNDTTSALKDSNSTIDQAPAANFDPSTFILREATTSEKIWCWRTNSASWAGKLTTDEYIVRETVNGSAELTREGGIRYWIFTEPALPTSADTIPPNQATFSAEDGKQDGIYAAVETLKKEVALKTRDGGFSLESSWAIASVFTPLQHRRKKVASWMMRRLAEWLDSTEACRFSILFSDVGEYYRPLGWCTFPNRETSLPIGSTSSLDTTPLTSDNLRALCEEDVAAVISDIRSAPIPEDKYARFALLPTYAQAAWHFGTEEYIASKIFRFPPRVPSTKGAISSSDQTWSYWVHDYSEDKLILLRLVSLYSSTSDEEGEAVGEIAAVLRAAQVEAADWALHKVVIWNPQPRTLEACKLVLGGEEEPQVRERTEGNIPGVRWIGGVGNGEFEMGLEWVALEKYCWC